MRLLYLYPEEWTGRRAREIHTLATCAALAEQGVEVTLVTAGGMETIREHCAAICGKSSVPNLRFVTLLRKLGPVKSATIFSMAFRSWCLTQKRFDLGYIIHLKASVMLKLVRVPYVYEAHEVFACGSSRTPKHQEALAKLELEALTGAARKIATSNSLAEALRRRYELPDDFAIVPNAGHPPLAHSLASAKGPFVYFGGLSDWKGIDVLIKAGYAAKVPLKIIGGTRQEWNKLQVTIPPEYRTVDWEPRVGQDEMPQALAGARCGLIATDPASPSGLHSCPMKLFDYARCGLPVLSVDLLSLASLHVGGWCKRVHSLDGLEWMTALAKFEFRTEDGEAALAWAGEHTWSKRAQALISLLKLTQKL